MSQVNEYRIFRAIEDIEKSIGRLKKLGELSLDSFLANEDYQDIARSRLLIAIEACINICYHLVAKKLKKVPHSYSHCFEILGDMGFITPELARSLSAMCRFRNRLVHLYWDIDYRLVYDIMHANLTDMEKFITAIKGNIGRGTKSK